jgi:Holliday junction resolvase RusA-like endonuclease
MAKIPRTISTVLPPYQRDRNQWRRNILKLVLKARKERRVDYDPDGRFEVVVLLYLKKGKRHDIHDVDNRLKDILDALQGRFGGPKSVRGKSRLIHNDRQVSRVVIEKQVIPKSLGDEAGGRLLIRPYEPRRWPLQRSKAISSGSRERLVTRCFAGRVTRKRGLTKSLKRIFGPARCARWSRAFSLKRYPPD